jgi:hypothetical protein
MTIIAIVHFMSREIWIVARFLVFLLWVLVIGEEQNIVIFMPIMVLYDI